MSPLAMTQDWWPDREEHRLARLRGSSLPLSRSQRGGATVLRLSSQRWLVLGWALHCALPRRAELRSSSMPNILSLWNRTSHLSTDKSVLSTLRATSDSCRRGSPFSYYMLI